MARVEGRRYLECPQCGLAFMHPADRLSADLEKARYDTHENDPSDPGYRAFLARLADPLGGRLVPGARGLDFGSGPGPTLSLMMTKQGFPMDNWDPFYAPDPSVLERSWDFVTCTETAEHFFEPAREFERLGRLLRPGGLLAIMTSWWTPDQDLADWYYVRDPTHVAFYRQATLDWIARDRGWEVEHPRTNVSFFQVG